MTDPSSKIPVTILTGFLGSGKTTLLNHILAGRHGHRIAVIENEVGEVDVDSDLVMTSKEEIFQIVNDCLCCVISVRDDLVKILHKLLEMKDQFDSILVEASGLTDPTPIAATFFKDEVLARQLSLDGIVTLVDALHFERHLEDPALDGHDNQAVDQILVADRILLNKTDLVDDAALVRIESRIRGLNATADILRTRHAQVDLRHILGIQGFAPSSLYIREPHFLSEPSLVGNEHSDHDHGEASGHEHDPSISSVSHLFEESFDLPRLETWLQALVEADGDHLFRLKGIVAIAGDTRRYVLQGVHRILELRAAEPWDGQTPRSKFVFIGRHLQGQVLRAGLSRCLAIPEPCPA